MSLTLSRVVASIILIFLGLSPALAQTQCTADSRGTVNCPTYTAPATTAVSHPSVGGSIVIPSGRTTTLFAGAVPPNGFMVQLNSPSEVVSFCYVNDSVSANGNPPTGFLIGGILAQGALPNIFVSPQGYKPRGPVSIWCTASVHTEVRAW
jgi:hypothetical protein